ncbi:hypothetical protein HanIR_Chr02g0063011 [Helianthus annuus]|nr:hypothetical protein HanIR_Chr02g0063011 [Helianthus annuus]
MFCLFIIAILVPEDNVEGPRTVMSFRSFDNPRQEVVQAPIRSKSVLSSFFCEQKTPKLRTWLVS